MPNRLSYRNRLPPFPTNHPRPYEVRSGLRARGGGDENGKTILGLAKPRWWTATSVARDVTYWRNSNIEQWLGGL